MFGRTSRPSVRLLAAVAVAVALGLALLVNSGKEARAGETTSLRPNFVVVMTDDQPPGMMKALPLGRAADRQPRRDVHERFRLAIRSAAPRGRPSSQGSTRTTTALMGNTPQSGGGYPALERQGLDARLVAPKPQGYETAFAGKWLNGLRTPKAAPPGWDRWDGTRRAGRREPVVVLRLRHLPGCGARRLPLWRRHPSDYQTDVLVPRLRAAADLRSRRRRRSRSSSGSRCIPRTTASAVTTPPGGVARSGSRTAAASKQSAIPPPRYARFAHAAVPRPPSFDEADVSDKPEEIAKSRAAQQAPTSRSSGSTTAAASRRCSQSTTRCARSSATLEQTGQLSNTVLIFTSDNGALAGEHRVKAGKNRPYDEALRVPLEISGPTILAGSHPAGPVVNADLAPTILDLAGADDSAGSRADARRNLAHGRPFATGRMAETRAIPIEGRDNVVASKHGFKATSYVGVRTSRWSYVEYRRASSALEAGRDRAPDRGRTDDRESSSTTCAATRTNSRASPRCAGTGWCARRSAASCARSSVARARSASSTPSCPTRVPLDE